MISIAGGSYYEICISPDWRYLFGSGMRAAAAISDLDSTIKLHTYIGEKSLDQLQSLAETFGLELQTEIVPHTIRFDYFHALSVPVITPPLHRISKAKPLIIADDVILRFGMIEGDAIVSGNKVIYDPQSAEAPQSFHGNGSTANHLAIVANMRECCFLSGKTGLTDIISHFFDKESCEVLIIKSGSNGTHVVTKDKRETMPAFKTNTVWPIGSGDVFSAIFSYFWGVKNVDPFSAAKHASLATAYYCSHQLLPIQEKLFAGAVPYTPIAVRDKKAADKKQIYLAGPFFTISQRWLVEETRNALRHQGLQVFSPIHDVGKGSGLEVAPADLKGLDESSVVLAIVDGLDAGTIFEIGYARAKNIPVICFVQTEKEEDLKMMEGSGCLMVNDFASAIYHTAWTYMEL